jgi:phosphopentomutase
MSRAFVLVLDSLGVGGAPDAPAYGDEGADTLGHIAARCASGDAERSGVRSGALRVPHLAARGLGEACRAATGATAGLEGWREGRAGCAAEVSRGKDSQTGHWEIAGAPVEFEWTYFPRTEPCFPPALIEALCARGGIDGILGARHASGTEIIAELGAEHLRSGRPICYTSADSVFQIAAHEDAFGLERLYRLCEIARELLDPLRVGRVIARPFTGTAAAGFTRTAHRRDYGVTPPPGTLLRRASDAGRDVVSVGKIGDLFCHDATGRELKGADNERVFDRTAEAARTLGDGGFLFANFVDFDTLYGHRRDVAGYAAALEDFDARLPELLDALREGDLVVVTGDHGCDPTWPGSDHTRECIPLLAFGPGVTRGALGRRASFADIGAGIARHLGLPNEVATAFHPAAARDTRDPWTNAMRRGDFQAAWRISDGVLAARAAHGMDGSVPRHLQSLWDGRSLAGRRVLVHCYHGLGDTLQFVRLLAPLRALAAEVTLWAQPALLGLLRGVAGADRIEALHDGAPAFARNADVELMELPHVLRLDAATIPRAVPYLRVPAPRRRRGSPLRVGLAWRAGDWDPARSIPAALLARLAAVRGVRWVSLQYPHEPLPLPAVEAGCRDVLELARRMRLLDRVISVDTMTAHLAGALGLPAWTLLPTPCDWRWMEARADSPWYPTMRLLRQARPGDWHGVIERLVEALAAWRDDAYEAAAAASGERAAR